MKVNTRVKCPGCKEPVDLVNVKYPGILDKVAVSAHCQSCKSDVLFSFQRPRASENKEKGTLSVQAKVMKASQLLVDLIKEQSEHNEKPLEE